MTKEEAINKMIERRPTIERAINRLMTWDEGKTLNENAEVMHITPPGARVFAIYYGLTWRPCGV